MLELIFRIGFSLLVVFGLMWGLARLARRPLAGRTGAALSVVARQQLGRASSVAVIRLGDRALVLGVTDTQVNLLAETDMAELDRLLATPGAVRESVALTDNSSGTPAVPGQATSGPITDGRLGGSLLSPRTWRQTIDFLRDRTARH